MVIVHGYVSLPEGNMGYLLSNALACFGHMWRDLHTPWISGFVKPACLFSCFKLKCSINICGIRVHMMVYMIYILLPHNYVCLTHWDELLFNQHASSSLQTHEVHEGLRPMLHELGRASRMWPPVISWFINPMKWTIVRSTIDYPVVRRELRS